MRGDDRVSYPHDRPSRRWSQATGRKVTLRHPNQADAAARKVPETLRPGLLSQLGPPCPRESLLPRLKPRGRTSRMHITGGGVKPP